MRLMVLAAVMVLAVACGSEADEQTPLAAPDAAPRAPIDFRALAVTLANHCDRPLVVVIDDDTRPVLAWPGRDGYTVQPGDTTMLIPSCPAGDDLVLRVRVDTMTWEDVPGARWTCADAAATVAIACPRGLR